MSIRKTPGGRFRAQLKNGRQFVGSRTFDTKKEASAWLKREKAALDGGIDPRAGKERVSLVVERWLKVRESTVAPTTYRGDRNMVRLLPTSMKNVHLSAISEREVARSFETLLAKGLADGSVVRYRASLSAFFAWCVREKLIASNPVTGVKVPKGSDEVAEMDPFSEYELEAAYLTWKMKDERLADILLVMGWTGLRWGEVRAMQVANFVEVPTPGLMVRRSQPEGFAVKSTKGRSVRRVPLADRVLSIVRSFAEGKAPGDLLFTTRGGGQLWRTHTVRELQWKKTGRGRRLHDLRHTAACLWLSRGVEPGTVQAWCGHESIATTNRYLHFLGTDADKAGLNKLNDGLGSAGGARDARDGA
ncbi:tyrosine-type recombinase/integrase [Myceligenerans salitolerans]|uniref:Tyrosine-type recombinase/integrase n=1 Tax=Myceligenerans salitolerans TaxID=1230528 RepID=A0ABS3I9D8_9MICO|nr:tyrosine-type recombinase/integrase [Myceligenerans salitolerans]MBO0609578.1 tyrosine-type recombinase/integrase [Myceligenerans salitolerans]